MEVNVEVIKVMSFLVRIIVHVPQYNRNKWSEVVNICELGNCKSQKPGE